MTATIVRRVKLPAHHSSPGQARAAVRAVLTESHLDAVMDEALLLTTELATNSVVHAGTDLELEIVTDSQGVTVTVMDLQTGPLTTNEWAGRGPAGAAGTPGPPGTTAGPELGERGRGLLLVDRLSSCWGTLHYPTGKGVWFRLDRPGDTPREISGYALVPRRGIDGAARDAAPDAVFALITGGIATGTEHNTLAELGAELLRRVCQAIGARRATVAVDEGDGTGTRTIASYGSAAPYAAPYQAPTRGSAPTRVGGNAIAGVAADNPLRVPLALTRPWRGELLVTPVTGPYASALAHLTAERFALLVENHRLRRADTERRSWLTFLAEASQLLAQSLDIQLTLALIPRLVVPRLGRWCAVHTADAEGHLLLAAATHADESEVPALTDALAAAQPQLLEALSVDTVMPLAAPVEGYAVALIARGQQLGTLSVGRALEHWQATEEVAVVEDVARRAALAIDNARIHAERREIAQTLQRSLLPPQLPKVDGIDFGAEYVPAGEGVDVGGDFYDVVALSDRRWLVVVGDVSGKGVHAATVTGLVRDVTRALVRDGRPLPEVLSRLNETLVERGGGRFCTLVLAAVAQRVDGLLDVTLHLAGHDKPVLIHADGATALVGRCGTALGLLDRVISPAARIPLAAGDTLVFFTDGVTERRRGAELFGLERLCHEASALAGFPADMVAARLRAATLNFSAETPRDDIAIFALRNDTTT